MRRQALAAHVVINAQVAATMLQFPQQRYCLPHNGGEQLNLPFATDTGRQFVSFARCIISAQHCTTVKDKTVASTSTTSAVPFVALRQFQNGSKLPAKQSEEGRQASALAAATATAVHANSAQRRLSVGNHLANSMLRDTCSWT